MTSRTPNPSALPGWPRLLTLTLAAAYCGVSEDRFLGLVNRGVIPPPIALDEGERWDLWGLQDVYIPEPGGEPAQRRWTEHDGVSGVYIIGFGDYVKIGVSASVGYRLRGLAMNLPEDLTVYAVLPGANRADERDLHRQFRHLRTRGEWFRKADDLMEFIRSAKAGR